MSTVSANQNVSSQQMLEAAKTYAESNAQSDPLVGIVGLLSDQFGKTSERYRDELIDAGGPLPPFSQEAIQAWKAVRDIEGPNALRTRLGNSLRYGLALQHMAKALPEGADSKPYEQALRIVWEKAQENFATADKLLKKRGVDLFSEPIALGALVGDKAPLVEALVDRANTPEYEPAKVSFLIVATKEWHSVANNQGVIDGDWKLDHVVHNFVTDVFRNGANSDAFPPLSPEAVDLCKKPYGQSQATKAVEYAIALNAMLSVIPEGQREKALQGNPALAAFAETVATKLTTVPEFELNGGFGKPSVQLLADPNLAWSDDPRLAVTRAFLPSQAAGSNASSDQLGGVGH